ncbi:pyruvate dehydrogenase (acetyl-transferring) E1 component subunit alpha [Isoptericola variabilis]|uniref:Pyruvate dehydrogenase (Acetyl-transferring) E1 component, alpha subunit n=1 Tax=Isoptericola variabilis (strain 225) TaxID=743718 RepID=F6FUQ1_ISOV2|nr:pyruvate dehydrogenase (acetyl-transferring) E1 component subunit alpha [Isoptericola variabilis]AEG43312.1 pyruvate dehydrogenase (acetyl-transferring) E1 component, alpha subunit [Isoptericola variabilis 225]TWH35248.1 pyruvate dehydrogenase E1 component alpha subunit [Isoptericola variabilis J7]
MPSTMGSTTRGDLSRAGTTRRETVNDGHQDAVRPSTAGTAGSTEPAVATVRLLDEDGVRHPDPEHDRWLPDLDGDGADEALLRLYEDMVVVRRIDAEATALQRQGQLALWPPLLGQEASQIGSAHALRADDFVFSSYREHAVAHVRGARPVDLLRVWRGVTGSGWNPYEINMATPQVIIGAQALHAMGYAMGILADADRGIGPRADGQGTSAVVGYFGDGAMSQGDVNEAFVFAATWAAPVVFFCQNNQWAISEPVTLQSRVPLVQRASGFGIPGVRVDGNDVLAVLAVTREALHRARTGGGPTLIEAVTYRMGPHTTADDPTRYRTPEELEEWRRRDPITRLEAYLRSRGALTEEVEARVKEAADRVAAELRAGCTAIEDPPPLTVFEHVYAEPNATVAAERDEYARYLAGFADTDDDQKGAAR